MKNGMPLLLMLPALCAGLALSYGLMQMLQAKPWYHLQTRMLYLPNGEATTVRVHVRNAQGQPVAGAVTRVMTSSGSTLSTTGKDGTSVCQVHERIEGILVNERGILRSYLIHPVPTGIDVYYLEE